MISLQMMDHDGLAKVISFFNQFLSARDEVYDGVKLPVLSTSFFTLSNNPQFLFNV